MSDFNLAWIDRYIDKQDLVVFDIGAFDGTDSIRLASHPKVKEVHAFEASPRNFVYLEATTKGTSIRIHNLALSDRDANVQFFDNLNEYHGSGSILRPSRKMAEQIPHIVFLEPVVVGSTSVSSFCSRMQTQPDVCHIDVQGAEIYVVSGFGDHRPKLVFCESCEYEMYEGAQTRDALDAAMIAMGYGIEARLRYDTLYVLQ